MDIFEEAEYEDYLDEDTLWESNRDMQCGGCGFVQTVSPCDCDYCGESLDD